MRESFQVKYEPLAQIAIRKATGYIAAQAGRERAAKWLKNMLESVSKLESQPKAFGVWKEHEGQTLYSKLVSPYRVFYVIDDPTATVHVFDIVHNAHETKLKTYRDPSG